MSRLDPESAARLSRMVAAFDVYLDHVPVAGRRDGDPEVAERAEAVIHHEAKILRERRRPE